MADRIELEERERRDLSPWATLSRESKGRQWSETPDPFRRCFSRDRDRLLHSAAFRRLQSKTQVLCVSEGDHYRTRLTHTLEVWQMASSAALNLGLNTELTTAVALAHDLGHPPFGHAGESALAEIMEGKGEFSHNAHAARLVDVLEHRSPAYPGLNLTFETRRSLLKRQPPEGFPLAHDLLRALSLPIPMEALLVDLADTAAYLHHDLEDGLHKGLLAEEEVGELRLWRDALAELSGEGREVTGPGRTIQILARMIKRVNQDMIRETARAFEKAEKEGGRPRPCLTVEIQGMLDQVEAFLYEKYYGNPKVKESMARAVQVLWELFERFNSDPGLMAPPFPGLIPEWGLERTICDYLSGMTDRYAATLAGIDTKDLTIQKG